MITYCTVCRAEIPQKRAARNSPFCSEACRAAHRKARRDWRATRTCRLCGREARVAKPKAKATVLPQGHNNLFEGLPDLIGGKL